MKTEHDIVVALADALQEHLYDQNEFSNDAYEIALEALELLGRKLKEID